MKKRSGQWWDVTTDVWCRVRGDLVLHATLHLETGTEEHWLWTVDAADLSVPQECGFATTLKDAKRFADESADGIEARRQTQA